MRGADRPDARDQLGGRRHRLAAARGIAHVLECIERGLQRGDCLSVCRRGARLERFERGLHLVTQIPHRAEPCHPGAAFQRVEDALQLEHRADIGAVASPTAEHGVRLLEQLVGFLAEDTGNIGVELDIPRRQLHVVSICGRCRPLRARRLGTRNGELPGARRYRRRLGRRVEPCELTVERAFEPVPAHDQAAVIREEPGVLVDVIDDLLERVQRIREQAQAFGRQSVSDVVELPDVMLHRLGDLDPLAHAGRLRDAAQGVAGAVKRLGHRMRCRVMRAPIYVVANRGDVTRGFLAEDVLQHRVDFGHLRWCRFRLARRVVDRLARGP